MSLNWKYTADDKWPREGEEVMFCDWHEDKPITGSLGYSNGHPRRWLGPRDSQGDKEEFYVCDVYAWCELPKPAPKLKRHGLDCKCRICLQEDADFEESEALMPGGFP